MEALKLIPVIVFEIAGALFIASMIFAWIAFRSAKIDPFESEDEEYPNW